MLIIERITLVTGDSKESLTKTPVVIDNMTIEQFRDRVMSLFKCDKVLLTYTGKEENENEDQ